MISVALIGADGAGKTTVARRLERELALPVKYIYMGVNLEASNCMLPTSRAMRWFKRRVGAKPDTAGPPPPPSQMAGRRPGGFRGAVRGLKSWLSMSHRMADQWYRQLTAQFHRARGCVVVFDRHYFFDYHAYDIQSGTVRRPLVNRLHGQMLKRLYPKPDLVVFLDAPAEVLFARKGEGSIAALERRRGEYFSVRELVDNFAVVDATLPESEVASEVADRIRDVCARKKEQQKNGCRRQPLRSPANPVGRAE